MTKASPLKAYSKSTTFIHWILTGLGALAVLLVVLYGDDRWFSKDRGEEVERKLVLTEVDSKHRDEMIMQEQKHTNQGVADIKTLLIDHFKAIRDERRNP